MNSTCPDVWATRWWEWLIVAAVWVAIALSAYVVPSGG